MRKRLFAFQWSLRSLLLLTAAVAVWVGYLHLRRQIPPLETQIASLQEMARELIVEDEDAIAVVGLPEMWYDESRWEIYLPEGRYRMRLATRQIDDDGTVPPVAETLLDGGRHRLELLQAKEQDRRKITILVDDQPRLEATESLDWDPGHGSSGGNEIGKCVQLPPDRAVVLYRRRFLRQLPDGGCRTPNGPTEGLLLWIERSGDGRHGSTVKPDDDSSSVPSASPIEGELDLGTLAEAAPGLSPGRLDASSRSFQTERARAPEASDLIHLLKDAPDWEDLPQYAADATVPAHGQLPRDDSIWGRVIPYAPETPDEAAALAALRAKGNKVLWLGQGSNSYVAILDRRATDEDLAILSRLRTTLTIRCGNCYRITNQGLAQLASFEDVSGLYLGGTDIGDAGLVHVGKIKSLNLLSLTETLVTDAGLAHLRSLENLVHLGLNRVHVGNAGIAHLAVLVRLRSLRLNRTRITDEGIAHLRDLVELKELDLSATEVTDAGLVHLGHLACLEKLDLSHTGVTDAGIVHLSRLTSLRELDLSGARITGEGLADLSGLANLEELKLADTGVTDGSLESFLPRAHLRFLDICNTPASVRAAAQLEVMFPRLQISAGVRSDVEGIPATASMIHPAEKRAVEALLERGVQVFLHPSGRAKSVISNTARFSDRDLAHVRELSELQRLWICGSRVTDAGLEQIHTLDNLERVWVRDSEVTQDGVKKLREAIPNAEVIGD